MAIGGVGTGDNGGQKGTEGRKKLGAWGRAGMVSPSGCTTSGGWIKVAWSTT